MHMHTRAHMCTYTCSFLFLATACVQRLRISLALWPHHSSVVKPTFKQDIPLGELGVSPRSLSRPIPASASLVKVLKSVSFMSCWNLPSTNSAHITFSGWLLQTFNHGSEVGRPFIDKVLISSIRPELPFHPALSIHHHSAQVLDLNCYFAKRPKTQPARERTVRSNHQRAKLLYL